MRLHGFSHSSSTWRVRIALAFKSIPHEEVLVDVRRGVGEQHRPGFEKLNAMRQIPVLEWEESSRRTLSQSMAILQYLEQIRPEPPLWPAPPFERARATMLAEMVNAGIQPLQNNGALAELEELGVDADAWARSRIQRGLAALEVEAFDMAGSFLLGDDLSVADVFCVPQLYNARRYGLEVEEFPTLTRCERECLALPAFAETHPDAPPRP
jgi:maleylpyruvate isomerase